MSITSDSDASVPLPRNASTSCSVMPDCTLTKVVMLTLLVAVAGAVGLGVSNGVYNAVSDDDSTGADVQAVSNSSPARMSFMVG